jgi:hypothetical protein
MQTSQPIKNYLETADKFAEFVKTRGEKMEEMSRLDFQQCFYDFMKTYVCVNGCSKPVAHIFSCVTTLPGLVMGPTVYLTGCFGAQGLQACIVKNTCALLGISAAASFVTIALAPAFGAACLYTSYLAHSFFADKSSGIQDKKNQLNEDIKKKFEQALTPPVSMSMKK